MRADLSPWLGWSHDEPGKAERSRQPSDPRAEVSALLAALGVPHVLVGGLAVGVHGHIRATKDVDFMVGESALTVRSHFWSTAKNSRPSLA